MPVIDVLYTTIRAACTRAARTHILYSSIIEIDVWIIPVVVYPMIKRVVGDTGDDQPLSLYLVRSSFQEYGPGLVDSVNFSFYSWQVEYELKALKEWKHFVVSMPELP